MPIKKTHEEFVAQVYNLVADEYKVLDRYKKSSEKINIKHNNCGFIYEVTPNNFINGNRCPNCFGTKKRTTEQFKNIIYDLVKEEYTVLGEYINNNSLIKIKHNLCGNVYQVYPNNFLSGKRCGICAGNVKKTHDQFLKDIYKLVKGEYTVLSEYVGVNHKIKMKHNICGNEYEVVVYSFLAGNRCSLCSTKRRVEKRTKTHEQFIKDVHEKVGNEYKVLGKYKNGNTKIRMIHNSCGFVYKVKPSSFLVGARCSSCNGNAKKTTDQFKKEVFALVENEYQILEEYQGSFKKVKIKHNLCGKIYESTPHSFLTGRRCPKCNASKGEKTIEKWLNDNNIRYIHNKPYGNCRYKQLLRFDFRLYKKDGSVIMIEFQGEGHDTPIEFRGGQKALEEQQIKDQIKRDYCKKHNIPLLEIWYWDLNNIDQILNDQLLPLNLIKQENPAPLDKLEQKQLEFSF